MHWITYNFYQIQKKKKKNLGSPFSIHDLSNSWNGCRLNSCHTQMYDNCILTIISQIQWHMPIHVTQWCYSDDAALPWWFVCHVGLEKRKKKKYKNDPAFTAHCGWRTCENVLGLYTSLSPHPLPYYQSKNSRVYVNWQKLVLNCLWSLHSPQLIVI